MQSEQNKRAINKALFADPDFTAYAVLDGASVPDLVAALKREQPEYCCLYRGEMPPDLEAAAPWLVRLMPDAPFVDWVISQGWGNHWGIFALSRAGFRDMRKHFRTFLLVKTPDGRQVYFRYYDPRVLRKFVGTCSQAEALQIFGPVKSYIMESDQPDTLVQAAYSDGQVKVTPASLAVIDTTYTPAGTGAL